MFKIIYGAFLAFSMTEIYAQHSFNVRTPDGRIISSKEWVESTDDYGERISRQLRPLIAYAGGTNTVTPCEVTTNLNKVGKIENITISKMSSDPKWCDAVIKAIKKSDYLPSDKDGDFPRQVIIKFTP